MLYSLGLPGWEVVGGVIWLETWCDLCGRYVVLARKERHDRSKRHRAHMDRYLDSHIVAVRWYKAAGRQLGV